MTNDSTDVLRREIATLLPRLRRFGRSLTGHREDADDLVQLAIERALIKSRQWQPGTRLDSWIFRIMQNAWIDEVRARSRYARTFLPPEAGEHIAASESSQDDSIAIEQAMRQLSAEQRAAVALVLVEGLPYKDAAQVLEIPIGTLTSRLARARETLQRVLGAEGSLQ